MRAADALQQGHGGEVVAAERAVGIDLQISTTMRLDETEVVGRRIGRTATADAVDHVGDIEDIAARPLLEISDGIDTVIGAQPLENIGAETTGQNVIAATAREDIAIRVAGEAIGI